MTFNFSFISFTVSFPLPFAVLEILSTIGSSLINASSFTESGKLGRVEYSLIASSVKFLEGSFSFINSKTSKHSARVSLSSSS